MTASEAAALDLIRIGEKPNRNVGTVLKSSRDTPTRERVDAQPYIAGERPIFPRHCRSRTRCCGVCFASDRGGHGKLRWHKVQQSFGLLVPTSRKQIWVTQIDGEAWADIASYSIPPTGRSADNPEISWKISV